MGSHRRLDNHANLRSQSGRGLGARHSKMLTQETTDFSRDPYKTFQGIGHNDLAHQARLPASAAETWRAVTKISLVKEEPASPISFLTPDAP
jgi:hypothetical protein